MASKGKSKKTAPPKPEARGVTRRELADLLDVHMQTVMKWEQAGMPVLGRGRKGKPNQYSEADVRQWLAERDEAQRTGQHVDVAQERARKERAQAFLAVQTVAIRARTLVRAEEVARTWSAYVMAIRARMLAWPMTYADRLNNAAKLEGLRGVERVLKDMVDELLVELVSGEAAPDVEEAPSGRSSRIRNR
jgi:phage terminase Nu1 subunit (DNA packaging protein)